MKDEFQDSNNFLSWAKRVSSEHPDILEHMLKSQDVFDKVIAKRILAVAGGDLHEKYLPQDEDTPITIEWSHA